MFSGIGAGSAIGVCEARAYEAGSGAYNQSEVSPKKSEFELESTMLATRIQILNESLRMLERRLDPVLTPSQPRENEAKLGPLPLLSAVCHSIRERSMEIGELEACVSRILSQLALP